jgi:two-component system chemotaxis sensor kinase CheA
MEKKKVLLLDDSKFILSYYTQHLKEYGFESFAANNHTVAEDLLKQENDIACILLDYEMPDIMGYEFCERLKLDEKYKNIPVIILTANDEDKHLFKAIDAGADDFICKKIDLKILVYNN